MQHMVLSLRHQTNNIMKNLTYKGAYLSQPMTNTIGVADGCQMWILVIWHNGAIYHRMFCDLSFWAKKEVVRQGFSPDKP